MDTGEVGGDCLWCGQAEEVENAIDGGFWSSVSTNRESWASSAGLQQMASMARCGRGRPQPLWLQWRILKVVVPL